MALRGFANTAHYRVETDSRMGYTWSKSRDGAPNEENLRLVVRDAIILKCDPMWHPKEWARIVDQRDGSEVCRIKVDASCQPSEWAKARWQMLVDEQRRYR